MNFQFAMKKIIVLYLDMIVMGYGTSAYEIQQNVEKIH